MVCLEHHHQFEWLNPPFTQFKILIGIEHNNQFTTIMKDALIEYTREENVSFFSIILDPNIIGSEILESDFELKTEPNGELNLKEGLLANQEFYLSEFSNYLYEITENAQPRRERVLNLTLQYAQYQPSEREGFEPNSPICSISVIYENSFR